jgi:hypothetical protein
LEDAVTGFIVHSEDQAVEAVRRIGALDRGRIRAEFERRFTARRMAQEYLTIFARLAQARRLPKVQVAGDTVVAQSLLTYRPAANAPNSFNAGTPLAQPR